MKIQREATYCNYCDKELKGRIDKKFCNDWCRNSYHFAANNDTTRAIRNIDNALHRNRRVLKLLAKTANPDGKVLREQLLLHGFSFRYYTNSQIDTHGKMIYYCYDHAYQLLSRGKILIVQNNILL
jgi:hypothetical protein